MDEKNQILINLLPQEIIDKRKAEKRIILALLVAAAIGMLLFGVFSINMIRLRVQEDKIIRLEDENANVVTTLKVPDGVDGVELVKMIRDKYGITLAGGQGHLKGEIVRIAHCGHYGAFDILTAIAALEMALDELGADIDLGSGVACAQKVFVESGDRAAV